MSVAKIILQQLGGGKFLAMTGSTNLLDIGGGLSFKIRAKCKSGIKYCRVKLETTDTYSVEFLSAACAVVSEFGMVYADGLRSLFSEQTGLALSLGPVLVKE